MRLLTLPAEIDQVKTIIKERTFDFQDERYNDVTEIVNEVRLKGDQAICRFTEKFDGAVLERLTVSQEEIEEAYNQVDESYIVTIRKAIEQVGRFHRKQLKENWFTYENGNMTGQLIRPLARVGIYVPGGRASYPSSVVMTAVPAKTAGVKEIVIVSPPDKEGKMNPYSLVAARETGVTEIYKTGGAQAIAALAYGTESIKAVDKIVGPGNIYVTLAKKIVYGLVDIDMLAGPSEVLVLADETAEPSYIAADLLSQAEHDPLSAAILITTSPKLAEQVKNDLDEQLPRLSRQEIAGESLKNNGLIIIAPDLEAGIGLVNEFAPEHFELMVEEPFAYLEKINNAGAIFIGKYSSEPVGDYLAGPNHVLPTGGTARYASPLNIDDFVKKSSLIYYQRSQLAEVCTDVARLARLEGLDAHARAVEIRMEGENLNAGRD